MTRLFGEFAAQLNYNLHICAARRINILAIDSFCIMGYNEADTIFAISKDKD